MTAARFSIACPPTAAEGDWPILTMRLSHHGDEPAYVPMRFAVAALGDVRLRVHRDDEQLACRQRIRLAPLRAPTSMHQPERDSRIEPAPVSARLSAGDHRALFWPLAVH